MSSNLTAFVDETGTNELDADKPGVSHLFICVAVVVDDAGLTATDAAIRQMSADLCSGAEVASKRIGGDVKRRMAFLERIQNLPFGYFALVINKDLIPKDSGLKFKTSFYKFINRMLYEKLAKTGDSLRIIADEIGGRDFMESFQPYLEKRGMPSLFQPCLPTFASSTATPCIQLADLIAGSLSYCFDPNKKGDHSSQFRELLRQREVGIQCWPPEKMSANEPTNLPPTHDSRLQKTMQTRVARFLDEYENDTDADRQMQMATLNELLFARQFEDRESQAIVSDILMYRLQHAGHEPMQKQAFQSRVIGKIRDEGIILAGASDGYRLALSEEDIRDYLDHDRNVIEPMLYRMLKARDSVKVDTAGQFDILDHPDYLPLKKIADTFRDSRIEVATARAAEIGPASKN